ncbi:MAG: hypothetical protein ABIJ19_00010 [Patescibacteria group bacterium]
MAKDQSFRIALAKKSHFWFFHFYFSHYVTFPTADFQREIFKITEDENNGMAVIVAFRGSSKSTICNLSFTLWSILGKMQKKYVIILGLTQRQARQHLINIKKELEQNALLKSDLGPFKEETDEWGGYSLVIPKYEARISAASTEQGIRGSRHLQYRPDIIIADDIEDLQSVRTQEGRDKTYQWFKGDILPAGSSDLKVIVIGNLLHEDSLIKRLQEEIEEEKLKGIYREFPLIEEKFGILWPGKYPDMESVEAERQKLSDESAWQREFLLKIIPAEDQVIKREWIQYYKNDEFPSFKFDKYSWTKIGIDLAISEKSSADYTAMVIGSLFGRYGDIKLYIHPFPVNERLDFPATVTKAKELADTAGPKRCELLIEEVAYQKALTQQLRRDWYFAKGVGVNGMDKRTRLSLVSQFIKDGKILFPRKGAEKLIEQIVGFGAEKHDDLMDAFVILALHVVEYTRQTAFAGGKFYMMG